MAYFVHNDMQDAGRGYRGGSSSVSNNNSRNQRGAHSDAGRSSNNDFEYAGRRGQGRFDADVLPSESASNAGDSDDEPDEEDYYPEQYQQREPMYQEREHQYQQQTPTARQRAPIRSHHEEKTMHDRMHSMGQRLKRSQTAQGILDFLGGPLRSKNRHNQRAKGNHYYDGPASAARKQAAHEVALARAAQREEAKRRRAEKLEMRRRAQAEAEAARREAAAMQVPEMARPPKQPRRHPQDQRSGISSSSSSRMRHEQMYQEDGMSSTVSSAAGSRTGMRPNNQTAYLQPPQPAQRKQQRSPARYDPKLGGYFGGSEVSSAVSGLTQTSSALGFKNPSLIYEGSSSAGSALSGRSAGSRMRPPRAGPRSNLAPGIPQPSSLPAPVRPVGAPRMYTGSNDRRGPSSALSSCTAESSISGFSQEYKASSSVSSLPAPVRPFPGLFQTDPRSQTSSRKAGSSMGSSGHGPRAPSSASSLPAPVRPFLSQTDSRSQMSQRSNLSSRSGRNNPPRNQPANTFEYLRNNVEKIEGYGEIHLDRWLKDQEDRRGNQQAPYKPGAGTPSTVSSAKSSRSGASSRR